MTDTALVGGHGLRPELEGALGRFAAERCVRPELVVVLPPGLDQDAGIVQAQEVVLVQALVPQPRVEALHVRVRDRHAGLDPHELDAAPAHTTGRAWFSAGAGGRLCTRCAQAARASGRRVGTLPLAVLDDARALLSGADDARQANWTAARTDLVRDFIGRFLDYHLETRLKSQRAFLAAPNRNAPAVR